MPLFGTLSTMPLTDVLQWVASARLTGTLQIERDKVSKSIVLSDGQVVGCSSDDPPERLGQFLIARGKITEEQLCHALTIQETTRRHLGMTLVEMGAMSAEELSSHLEAKAEETIYSLFDWEDAVFRFEQDVQDEANVFPISLRVEDVLLRGLKRFDEIKRIREVFYDSRLVLRNTGKTPPQAMFDNAMARTLYEAIDGDRTVAEIRLHVHGSEYVVTKFLFELYQNGFVEVGGIKKSEPVEQVRPHVATTPEVPGPVAAADHPPQPGPIPPPLPDAPPPSAVETMPANAPLTTPPQTTIPGEAEPAAAAPVAVAAPAPAAPVKTADPVVYGEVEVPGELESIEKSEAHQLARSLERARLHMRNGEFEGALDILDRLYQEYPGDESLRRLTTEAEVAFIEKAYRHYLPPTKIPRLTAPVEQLGSEAMSPTEFFLLSRIDGSWDIKSIVQIAPLRETDTLRTLKRMREAGIIELIDPVST